MVQRINMPSLERKEKINMKLNKKLGREKEYAAWNSMKGRCIRPNDPDYNNYGGRGIKICDEWVNSFEQFCIDMGKPPSAKHSIDRKDVNGNYEPNNCRWATIKEQANSN